MKSKKTTSAKRAKDPLPPRSSGTQDFAEAHACLRRNYARVCRAWRALAEARKLTDLACVVDEKNRDDDGGPLICIGDRETIVHDLNIGGMFPQMAQPAWQSNPKTVEGVAMWFVAIGDGGPVCLRMVRLHLVPK